MPGTSFIPIRTLSSESNTAIERDEAVERTLKDLGVKEADLEELVRKDIDILFPDGEETLMVVGQQVRNKALGRSDLVALDGQGNIVLIEMKRDKDDIAARQEPFGFQAIRYAANYALVRKQQEVVQQLFVPYIERHREDPQFQPALASGLAPPELAIRKVREFLSRNAAQGTLNRYQRIVLIASGYDEQTLSACAWLAKNGIDLRCITITPIEHKQQVFLKIEQVIPPPTLEGYYVEVAEQAVGRAPATTPGRTPKQTLPRMADLLEWGLVSVGDTLHIRGYEDERAEVVDQAYVKYQNQPMKYNDWGAADNRLVCHQHL
jgi:hypothetical protein